MKNNGLLKLLLVLAFCGVLSVYALTEGSIERLELDAAKVDCISYVNIAVNEESANIEKREYIEQLVAELNNLELRKTYYKLTQEELNQATAIMITCGDVFKGEKLEMMSLIFLPDNRVLLSTGDNSEGCYTADYTRADNLGAALARETLKENQYAGTTWFFAVNEDMLK